jgi:transposase
MAKKRKTRRKFTKEFKAEVVKLVLDGGRGVPDVCHEQDLSESSVYLWVKQAQVDRGDGPAGALTTAEKAALAQLRRENRELRRERDFFEQATAYFAKAKR